MTKMARIGNPEGIFFQRLHDDHGNVRSTVIGNDSSHPLLICGWKENDQGKKELWELRRIEPLDTVEVEGDLAYDDLLFRFEC